MSVSDATICLHDPLRQTTYVVFSIVLRDQDLKIELFQLKVEGVPCQVLDLYIIFVVICQLFAFYSICSPVCFFIRHDIGPFLIKASN